MEIWRTTRPRTITTLGQFGRDGNCIGRIPAPIEIKDRVVDKFVRRAVKIPLFDDLMISDTMPVMKMDRNKGMTSPA